MESRGRRKSQWAEMVGVSAANDRLKARIRPQTVQTRRCIVANSKIDEVVSLAKRRGFVFPAGEIYGGTRSAWDACRRRTIG